MRHFKTSLVLGMTLIAAFGLSACGKDKTSDTRGSVSENRPSSDTLTNSLGGNVASSQTNASSKSQASSSSAASSSAAGSKSSSSNMASSSSFVSEGPASTETSSQSESFSASESVNSETPSETSMPHGSETPSEESESSSIETPEESSIASESSMQSSSEEPSSTESESSSEESSESSSEGSESSQEPIEEEIYKRVNENNQLDEEGDFVLFGKYPQAIKPASVTITSETPNSNGFYSGSDGEEYYKLAESTPNSNLVGYKFSDNSTTISQNTQYYFKVEPIKWRILGVAEDGTATILSESIIENTPMQSQYEKRGDNHYYNTSAGVPEGTYSNNYKYSELRSWLNDDFINSRFTEAQKAIIQQTTVRNDMQSAGFTFPFLGLCEDTNDKVFLLSHEEALNEDYGFPADTQTCEARKKLGSDYTKAKGLYVYVNFPEKASCWWLRSPDSLIDGTYASKIGDALGRIGSFGVSATTAGVAPAMKITL